MRRVKKTLSLPEPVAELLEEEPNQSALVEELLLDYYDSTPVEIEQPDRIRGLSAAFVEDCIEPAPREEFVTSARLRDAYAAHVDGTVFSVPDASQFGRAILALPRFDIDNSQKRIDGSPTRIYRGVTFTSDGAALLD